VKNGSISVSKSRKDIHKEVKMSKLKFGYSMPSTSPLYPQPPFYFENNKIISVVFTTTKDALRELVPAPLVPNPQNLAYIYLGILNVPQRGFYKEAGIGIPAVFGDQIGNYLLYLYLDEAFAIVPGREIWGWPKKDAELSIVEENGSYHASVSRLGATIIQLSLDHLQAIEDIPDSPAVPNYNLKIIPSVIKDHDPDVAQLTTSLVTSKKKILQRGIATLEFASSSEDPLGNLPVLDLLSGEYSVEDMSMDYGEVLFDYLREGINNNQ
jgi:acetoacetate decarboxylase